MSRLSSAVPPPPEVDPLDPDEVFSMLGNPIRRRILLALTQGPGLAASQLGTVVERTQDATLKHLNALRAARLVHMETEPEDHRRQRYTLSPAIQLRPADAPVQELDFGCCLWRVRSSHTLDHPVS